MLQVNQIELKVPKYFLYLISETIKDLISHDDKINEYIFSLTDDANLKTVLIEFQDLFIGNNIEICKGNISIFKEISEHLKIYPLRKACLRFEKKANKQNQFYSLFQQGTDPEFLDVVKLECFSIYDENPDYNLDQLICFAVDHFVDLSNRNFFPRSFQKFIQNEDQIRDICSKTFHYRISLNGSQCDELEELQQLFTNFTGESGNPIAQAKRIIGISRYFEYSLGNQVFIYQ